MQEDQVVFPPMDPEVFAAKLAKYNARGPQQSKMPKSSFGRVAIKRLPKERFFEAMNAMQARKEHSQDYAMIPFPRSETT